MYCVSIVASVSFVIYSETVVVLWKKKLEANAGGRGVQNPFKGKILFFYVLLHTSEV